MKEYNTSSHQGNRVTELLSRILRRDRPDTSNPRSKLKDVSETPTTKEICIGDVKITITPRRGDEQFFKYYENNCDTYKTGILEKVKNGDFTSIDSGDGFSSMGLASDIYNLWHFSLKSSVDKGKTMDFLQSLLDNYKPTKKGPAENENLFVANVRGFIGELL